MGDHSSLSRSERLRVYQGDVLEGLALPRTFKACVDVWHQETGVSMEEWAQQWCSDTPLDATRDLLLRLRGRNSSFDTSLQKDLMDLGLEAFELVSSVGFRLVLPGTYAQIPYAYSLHRDTWYGIPEHGINLWLGLFNTQDPLNTMELFPDLFDQAVSNNSDGFVPQRWQDERGVRNEHQQTPEAYPHAPHAIVDGHLPYQVSTLEGQAIAFSSHQLHRTCQQIQQVRMSVDVRVLVASDQPYAPKNVDNRSA